MFINFSAKIKYTAGANCNSPVQIIVHDLLGKEVAALVNEEKQPGEYEVEFNGIKLSSGIYFYTLTAENYRATKKLILLK
jgi:hypothetical protein